MSKDDGQSAPMMDPQARRLLAMLALSATDASAVSPQDRRKSFEKLMRYARHPAVPVETVDSLLPVCAGAAIKIRSYVPDALGPCPPALIYFHGGGLVAGDLETHDALCRTLAAGSRVRVIAVDYRRAPEHPFPIPILDALRAARTLVRKATEFDFDAQRVAVGGDSGGATLATIVARLMRWHLRAQVLLCPVLDFAGAHASRTRFADGYLLDAATMRRDLDDYRPTRPLDDPFVSPLHAQDLAGMPATLIHTAGFDPLRDEGALYAERLRAAGVDVRLSCHETLIHHFYALDSIIPAAGVALSDITADLAEALR